MMYNQYKPKGICIFHIVRWAPKQVRCYIYTQTLYPVLKSDEDNIYQTECVFFLHILLGSYTVLYAISNPKPHLKM